MGRQIKLDTGRQFARGGHLRRHLVTHVLGKGQPVNRKGVAGKRNSGARIAAVVDDIFGGGKPGEQVALGRNGPGEVARLLPLTVALACIRLVALDLDRGRRICRG